MPRMCQARPLRLSSGQLHYGAKVPADHDTAAVGDSDVQLGHRQAPHRADHTTGLLLLLGEPDLHHPAQVGAQLQPQRHHLHGFGPSTRPWNITSAST